MRLTTFTDYTLRVLIYLAAQPDRRATIGDVARSFAISEHHVAKVVHFLGAAGLLDNVRGRGGGMHLAVPAVDINIGEVVKLAEGADIPAECFEPTGHDCVIGGGCRLKGIFAEAVHAFYDALGKYSLEDLVKTRETIVRMLIIPGAHRLADARASASSKG